MKILSVEKTSKSIWFVEINKAEEKERPNYDEKNNKSSDESDEDISPDSVVREVNISKTGYLNPSFDNERLPEHQEIHRASTNSYKAAISDNIPF